MKKNRILSFLSAGLLLLGGACTNDVLTPSGSEDNKVVDPSEGVYFSVNFDLPTAKSTRSYTDGENSSNSGTEIAQDYENLVSRVLLVLAKKTDNSVIAWTLIDDSHINEVGVVGRSYQVTGKLSKTDLSEYYDSEDFELDKDGNHKVNVFVFCNPTDALVYAFEHNPLDKWYDWTGKYEEHKTDGSATENISVSTDDDLIWGKHYFLMSNASLAERLLPSSLDGWDDFTTEAAPFNLSGMNNFGRPNQIDNFQDRGNVYVERTAARYDFRDGALDGAYYENSKNKDDKSYNGFAPQTYHVVLNTDEKPLVDVFLGKMCLVNMNNEYYYLRRVSDNGRPEPNTTGFQLCGPELPWYNNTTGGGNLKGNYVVDAYADWKYSGTSEFTKRDFSDHFNYPFFDSDGIIDNVDADHDRWYTQTIKSVLSEGIADNPDSWNTDGTHGSYKIWRYLTEGTIPGVNSQKNGVSNGIVFKGQMLPSDEAVAEDDFTKDLLNALKVVPEQTEAQVNNNPLLYQFANHLYCSWDHIRRVALSLAITDIYKEGDTWKFNINRSATLYSAVFGQGGFGSITISIEGNDGKTANFLTKSGNVTLTDDVTEYTLSPNYMYNLWQKDIEANPSVLSFELPSYANFRDAVVGNNITIYQESYDKDLGGWGYYCYYFYWNRHNDNGQNGVMGEMEFAVVRNNVYKLAVTKISRLGHPRIAVNDPDKPTPNTPDEKADVYLTVTCTTLPWVVRENNIEF